MAKEPQERYYLPLFAHLAPPRLDSYPNQHNHMRDIKKGILLYLTQDNKNKRPDQPVNIVVRRSRPNNGTGLPTDAGIGGAAGESERMWLPVRAPLSLENAPGHHRPHIHQ